MIDDLQHRLQAAATLQKKNWWESYMKGVTPFRGTEMKATRKHTAAWLSEHGILDETVNRQMAICTELMASRYAEDKLAALLWLAEHLLPRLEHGRDLATIAEWFDAGYIADWNVTDWFCVKLLGPWMARGGLPMAEQLVTWTKATSLWRRRAGVVSFVPYIKKAEPFGGYVAKALEACHQLVLGNDRFEQTAVGWLLRDLSHVRAQDVRKFLDDHRASMSAEALRTAQAKLRLRAD
ncbi:MAG: DNA alkylation repair protein [Acidobacteria bacterium]|nr:DNA alkylation repair protein [Acidobacteriota bacterium]